MSLTPKGSPDWWAEWTNYPHGSLDEKRARELSRYCVELEEAVLTPTHKMNITKLAHEISNNGGFALQNAEACHEKATQKYDDLRQQAYVRLINYLDSI